MKQIILLFVAVVAFIAIVGHYSQDLTKPSGESAPTQKEVSVGDDKVLATVADDEEERRQGLSGKEGLAENEAMLFVFPEKTSMATFWMKDMKFAIDIIWINDGKVVKIDKNAQPEPGVPDTNLKRYTPGIVVDSVLEVSAGFSDAKAVKIGEEVSLSL